MLPPAQRSGQCSLREGPESRHRLWNWLSHPKGTGLLAHRVPSDFVQPEASSARACCVHVHTSERELFEKHAFWHKVRDITHFIGFEALL